MNRDEIMKLTTEELRLEIAKAKGWTQLHPYKTHPTIHNAPYDGLEGIANSDDRYPSDILDWPNNIAAAWELVEEIRQIENIEVYIYSGFEGFRVTVFEANRNGEDDTHLEELASAIENTVPLAICRAWLMWKEGV